MGGYLPVTPNFHLCLEAGALYDGESEDFEGYLKPHLRVCAGPVEFKTGVELTTASGTNWLIQHELLVNVAGPVDLAFGFDWNDDVKFYNAGLRFRF